MSATGMYLLVTRDISTAVPPNVIKQQYPPVSSRGAALIIVGVVFPVIATLWTGLRIWTRHIRRISSFMTEDVMCYIATTSFWGLAVNYICMVTLGGAGHHIAVLQEHHIVRLSQTIFAAQVLYAFTLGFTKISITWMMKRIFFEQSHAIIAYSIMALCFAWMLQTIFTGIFICQPVNMNWNPELRLTGHCGNQTFAFAAVSVVDIITDFLILALPVKLLWGLQIKRSYKVALGFVFGAGLVTIAFTIVRLYYVFALDFSDMAYNAITLSIIGIVQPAVALMVASAPLLRPVLDRVIGITDSFALDHKSPIPSKDKGSSVGKSSIKSMKNSSAKRSRASTSMGFRQLSESEEHLRWELDVMHADKGKTMTSVSNGPPGLYETDESLPLGQIKVTQSTHVSRQ